MLPEIETERLWLRQLQSKDLEELVAIFRDPVVMRYVGNGRPRDRFETESGLRAMLRHWRDHGFGMWAVVEKQHNQLLGRCGLIYLDSTPEVEVGYTFAQAYWGQGYATEAAQASLRFGFEELQLDQIAAIAYAENTRSRRVMQKLGMTYQRDAHFYGVDVVYYAIARTDYHPDPWMYHVQHP